MALTTEQHREIGRKAAASWIAQRRADPAKMKKWLKAMRLGKLRKARERKLAATTKKETTVAKKAKAKDWRQNPKLMRAAVMKGHRTRKRLARARAREASAKEAQRRVVEHHAPEDLVHLDFPIVAGGPTRSTNGGHLGDDPAQLTPTHRKQLALEGLRFVKILLLE